MRHAAVLILAFATSSIGAASADPQPAAQGRFRGMIVCERIADTPNTDILHVPMDMIVRGGNVIFARPTFNPMGTRVTGNEIATGAIDADGKLHLTSEWSFRGFLLRGDYSGTLSATGGTLDGTQSWQGPNHIQGSRTCHAALVSVRLAAGGALQQPDQAQ
jgi:hypothetical protein